MSNDTFNCPKCGTLLKVIPLSGGGDHRSGGWKRAQAFPMGEPPAGSEYYREEPVTQGDVEGSVKVPLFQSLITGAVTGLVSVIPTVHYGWPKTVPVVVAVGTVGLAWWLLLQDSRRLLRRVESVVGADLDGDGAKGFEVEITEPLADGRKRMKFAHFPAEPDQVGRFAMACLNGYTAVHGGHGLSQTTFTRLRDEALRRGLLTWKSEHSHNQGCEMTRVGERVFERLLSV